jgi:hypothetical protein
MEGKWLFWQVLVPLLAPIIISGIVIIAWSTGVTTFHPNLKIVLDVSPWALTFYSLTLIGGTLNAMWSNLANKSGIGVCLILTAVAVTLYASFMVIWRHDSNFNPGTPVYVVTIFLLVVSVAFCHWGYKNRS